ncbi:MAG: hypothetical protein H6738_18455 [Alphaproteobacteria bacterium]|nr:hypothetical protein [Alphaproteobacteria bacterium]
MMWTMIGLAATAWAQEEVPTLDDDASVAPVVEKLAIMLEHLEGKGVQVTDIHLGRVKDDGVGVKLHLPPVSAGASAVVAGLGDDRRIVDLDLAVSDRKGGRWTDQLSDNNPVVQFDSAEGGDYDVNVLVSESVEGADEGFYLLVAGFMTDPSMVVSATNIVSALQVASQLAETLTLHFVDGGMMVMTQGQNASIDLQLPPSNGGGCFVMSFGDPARTKKLAMVVQDRSGNVVGTGKGKGLISAMVAPQSTASEIRVVLTPKIGGGVNDSHAMTLVACQ